MSFNNVLRNFRRHDHISVDCGNGFEVTVRRVDPSNQEFRAKAAEFANKRGKVSLGTDGGMSLTGSNDMRTEVEFFYNTCVVSWKGLVDDDGKTIAPSLEAAQELFACKAGQILMQELTRKATDMANFIIDDEAEKELVGKSLT